MKHVLTLIVVCTALVGVAVLLFAAAEHRGRPQQALPSIAVEAKTFSENSKADLPGFSSLFTAAANSQPYIAILDNDTDHDGNYDGIADPLGGLASGTAVLAIIIGLVTFLGVKLLSILCELLKRFSVWPQVLERPG